VGEGGSGATEASVPDGSQGGVGEGGGRY
jgi:hypothetical protein